MKILNLVLCSVIFSSCNEKKDHYPTNKLVSIELGSKNDTLNGNWAIFDKSNNLVTEINFANDSLEKSFMITQFDSNRKIIYEASYSNGRLLEENQCGDFQIISAQNGRKLYQRHLFPYFSQHYKNKKEPNLTEQELRNKIAFLKNRYPRIPDFNQNEIESLLIFFHKDEIMP